MNEDHAAGHHSTSIRAAQHILTLRSEADYEASKEVDRKKERRVLLQSAVKEDCTTDEKRLPNGDGRSRQ
jgi:hypothetical protein